MRNVLVTAGDHKVDEEGKDHVESLLPLDHDDVVAELGLDRGVGVGRVAETGHREGESSLLEGTHHRSSCLES